MTSKLAQPPSPLVRFHLLFGYPTPPSLCGRHMYMAPKNISLLCRVESCRRRCHGDGQRGLQNHFARQRRPLAGASDEWRQLVEDATPQRRHDDFRLPTAPAPARARERPGQRQQGRRSRGGQAGAGDVAQVLGGPHILLRRGCQCRGAATKTEEAHLQSKDLSGQCRSSVIC